MTDSFSNSGSDFSNSGSDLAPALDTIAGKTDALAASADKFAAAMVKAFSAATSQGRQFDSVLASLAVRLAQLAERMVLPSGKGGSPIGGFDALPSASGASAAPSPASVTVNVATPDADSFRRSDAYLAGQIARAVARGQRVL